MVGLCHDEHWLLGPDAVLLVISNDVSLPLIYFITFVKYNFVTLRFLKKVIIMMRNGTTGLAADRGA